MTDNRTRHVKTESGIMGEKYACERLEKQGCKIIQTNYRSRYGEIDIIACDGDYIAFIEVKTRGITAKAAPRAWVTQSKQDKIIKTAMIYLQSHQNSLQPRFDVVEVVTQNDLSHFSVVDFIHLKNAFWAKKNYFSYK